MPGFIGFARDQHTTLPIPQAPANIKQGTYIVTGTNSGLGYECVKHLLRMGAGRIILAVRTIKKGEAALAAIKKEISSASASASGNSSVCEIWELDLKSLDSVEAFAKRVNALDRVDALIANAGIAPTTYEMYEGVELSLFVNVVATMLLVLRAVPKLKESASRFGILTHLTVVASNTGLDMKGTVEKVHGDVFDGLSTKKSFGSLSQYPKTKLLQIYIVRELASIIPASDSGVVINCVNPGLCYTELTQNAGFASKMAVTVVRTLLARTAEEGSRNLLQAAFAGPDSHGTYCSECRIKEDDVPSWITDEAGKKTRRRVWDDLLKRLDSKGHGIDVATLVGSRKN